MKERQIISRIHTEGRENQQRKVRSILVTQSGTCIIFLVIDTCSENPAKRPR